MLLPPARPPRFRCLLRDVALSVGVEHAVPRTPSRSRTPQSLTSRHPGAGTPSMSAPDWPLPPAKLSNPGGFETPISNRRRRTRFEALSETFDLAVSPSWKALLAERKSASGKGARLASEDSSAEASLSVAGAPDIFCSLTKTSGQVLCVSVGVVGAIALAGFDLWFNSDDHMPVHFHAEKPGEWEVRVFFLRDRSEMFETKWTLRPGRPSRGELRELARLAERHRAALLVEWQQKVNVKTPGGVR